MANGIISPIVKFEINKESESRYPLKLSKIYLGPNFIEQDINKEFIREG